MAKKAFLYPGQASQYVGMGKDLYEHYEKARTIFDRAQAFLGFDLKRVCFEGPEEELKQTRITQPAIFIHSYIVTQLLKDKNMLPDFVAGHSLGEYSALVAAGVLSFEDALNVVKIRGEQMQKAGEIHPGTMAAIIGLGEAELAQLCQQASQVGVVKIANYNSPGQLVVSGSVEGVKEVMKAANEKGAKRVIELVVSGAFHSPLMEDAQNGLKQALAEAKFGDALIPVYPNVTAKATVEAEELRKSSFLQLTHPVLWTDIIQNIIAAGAEQFYEIGPEKVLTGLLKRINRDYSCVAVGTVEQLDTIQS
ncbi:ACP S-malonyltransferase [candidate division KSB1 bacterium]|nr:ACP S-malonyltransferase [candidate division KSB1 bacterium]